jgi:hypothetical protein
MDIGSRRRGIRVKLKLISFFNYTKNPIVRCYLAPLVEEEG